jgi:hypothetical protein
MLKKYFASPATAFARSVLPVPGGLREYAFGILPPISEISGDISDIL